MYTSFVETYAIVIIGRDMCSVECIDYFYVTISNIPCSIHESKRNYFKQLMYIQKDFILLRLIYTTFELISVYNILSRDNFYLLLKISQK